MAENGRQERSVLDDAKATFGKRWLAEAVRLSGEQSGAGINTRTENPVAEQKARAAGGSAEQRILVWAGQIGTASGLADEIGIWRRRAWLIVLIIAGLALAGGFATAVAVLGDGSRAVNILWALGALLGLHLFMLVLWLLGMLARSDGALLGRLGFWLATRIKTRHAGALVQAFVALNTRAGLTRWWLSLISHLVWLAALTGALAGLLFALALRSYVFVWETTILPESVFAQIVYLLSVVPDWLGLAVPDASTIGEASIISDAGVLQPDNVRRAWAGWLSGALLVYGIAPRALLALLCVSRVMWGIKRVRLNVKGSEWTMLVRHPPAFPQPCSGHRIMQPRDRRRQSVLNCLLRLSGHLPGCQQSRCHFAWIRATSGSNCWANWHPTSRPDCCCCVMPRCHRIAVPCTGWHPPAAWPEASESAC